MSVRLILTLDVATDPGVHTPEQVRDYGASVAEAILDAARRGADATIAWHAHQLVAVSVEVDPA